VKGDVGQGERQHDPCHFQISPIAAGDHLACDHGRQYNKERCIDRGCGDPANGSRAEKPGTGGDKSAKLQSDSIARKRNLPA
jgi:hypothetical protein